MSEAYPDLPGAAIAWLRASGPVVEAFGENTAALETTKFWADEARRGVELPWAVYEEPSENSTPVSADANGIVNYFCRGTLTFVVVAGSKLQARQLARLIAETLNDAPLVFEDGTLLEFRSQASQAIPVKDIGPDTPAVYARSQSFLYMVQRQG